MVIMVVGSCTVGVDAHVVHESICVAILITSNLDQVVPIHYWTDKVFELILFRLFLLFKVLTNFEPFILHFLTRSFSTVVEKACALSLTFICTNVALFQGLFLLLTYETDIQFTCLCLATFFYLLLIS
jgi:hypothetical protein